MSTAIPDDLGKLINADNALFKKVGWEQFIRLRRGRSNFPPLGNLRHPAKRILQQYSDRGVPVVLHTAPWEQHQIEAALT